MKNTTQHMENVKTNEGPYLASLYNHMSLQRTLLAHVIFVPL